MEQRFQGKTVPWLHLKTYLDIHERIISYDKLIKCGDMTIPEVESKLPKTLFQIHEEVTKLLKEHNILANEEDTKISNL
jgi:hypothetical protein